MWCGLYTVEDTVCGVDCIQQRILYVVWTVYNRGYCIWCGLYTTEDTVCGVDCIQ